MALYHLAPESLVDEDLLVTIENLANVQFEQRQIEQLARIVTSALGVPIISRSLTKRQRFDLAMRILHEVVVRTIFGSGIRRTQTGFVTTENDSELSERIVVSFERIPINTATASEIEELPSIGGVLASRIVNERELHGPYLQLSDLVTRVSGLNAEKCARIEDAIWFDHAEHGASGRLSISGEWGEDFSTLLQMQAQATMRENFDLALRLMEQSISSKPHPFREAGLTRAALRGLSSSMIDCEEVGILFGAEYYYELTALLVRAERSISVCMFHIALPQPDHPTMRLLTALKAAVQRGVRVKVLVDSDRAEDPYDSSVINQPAVSFLRTRPTVNCRFDKPTTLLHSKFIVIDSRIVVIGSHNWSAGSYFQFDDLSLAIVSSPYAQQMTSRFDYLWSSASSSH